MLFVVFAVMSFCAGDEQAGDAQLLDPEDGYYWKRRTTWGNRTIPPRSSLPPWKNDMNACLWELDTCFCRFHYVVDFGVKELAHCCEKYPGDDSCKWLLGECAAAIKTRSDEYYEVICGGACEHVDFDYCPGLTPVQILLVAVGVLASMLIITIIAVYCACKDRKLRLSQAPPDPLDDDHVKMISDARDFS
jgi:hypothetical protein